MKLCITGGGTGGHLMIAQTLAEAAVAMGHEVIFIGSTSGQDKKYFEHNSPFSSVYFLETTGVVNQKGFAKFQALFKVFKAFVRSRAILKKHAIQATYSVGGFSAAPASFASLSRFVPLFIHEQNAVQGRLNALLKPYAKRFISAYDTHAPIQGYPIHESFFKSARVRETLNTIIFLGGSQGAKAINDLALSVAKELQNRGIKIIHQTGESDFLRVQEAYASMGVDAQLYGFTKELPNLLSHADLAISRSGASTLWELCASGIPSLFVPYPHAAGDHQFYNAKFIVQNNLGWCQREGEGLREKLLAVLDEKLEQKSSKLLAYAKKDVAQQMIHDVEESLK